MQIVGVTKGPLCPRPSTSVSGCCRRRERASSRGGETAACGSSRALGIVGDRLSLGMNTHYWVPWNVLAHVPLVRSIIPVAVHDRHDTLRCGGRLRSSSTAPTVASRRCVRRILGRTQPPKRLRRDQALRVGVAAIGVVSLSHLAVAAVAVVPMATAIATNVPLTTTAGHAPAMVRRSGTAPSGRPGRARLSGPLHPGPVGDGLAGDRLCSTSLMVGGGGPGGVPMRAGKERAGSRGDERRVVLARRAPRPEPREYRSRQAGSRRLGCDDRRRARPGRPAPLRPGNRPGGGPRPLHPRHRSAAAVRRRRLGLDRRAGSGPAASCDPCTAFDRCTEPRSPAVRSGQASDVLCHRELRPDACIGPADTPDRASRWTSVSPQIGGDGLSPYAVAFAGYLALSVLLWWGVWSTHPTSVDECACNDPSLFVWFLEWPAYAIAHGHNPFYSTSLFHPTGINLLSNTGVLAIGVPLAPVTWLFGPVATLNVASTLGPALTALSMFWLLRRWVRWAPAAFVGGLVFGFSPFAFVNLAVAHLKPRSWFSFPLIVGCLDELLVRQRQATGAWSEAPSGSSWRCSSS